MRARTTGPAPVALVARNLAQLGLVAAIVWVAWGPGGPARAVAGGVAGGLLGWDVAAGLAGGDGPRVGPGARQALPFALAAIGALLGYF